MSIADETSERGYVAYLDCHHEILFKIGEPTAGDKLWCRRCFDYRVALHVNGNSGINCRDCRFARKITGRVSPHTLATSHALRHLGHAVDIFGPDGHKVVRFEPQLLTDIPPF